MILFNITVIIEEDINDEWLQWINHEFIPMVTSTKLILSGRLFRILDSPNEGITYSIQFISENIENYNIFRDQHEASLMTRHAARFENKFVSFSSLMEFIDKDEF